MPKELQALTVPQLRQLAGKHGLPKYQHNGRRLRKADLIRLLAAAIAPVYAVEVGCYPETYVGPGHVEHTIEQVRDHRDRVLGYCDPQNRKQVYRLRKSAYVAVCRRLIDEKNAAQAEAFYARQKAGKKCPRKRVWSQREIDSQWSGNHVMRTTVATVHGL